MSEEPLWKRHRKQLDALYDLEPNFDLDRTHQYTEENGWNIDEYEAELPSEPSGAPIPGGPWEIAKRIIHDYKFPPPEIITGIYYPDRPLEERVILLQAKFLLFTFYFGVRIGGVIDERRETEKGPAQIWGFCYQTLEGHFEQGQMNFEVWKWLETGKIAFRIYAFSRTNEITNPFYRLGFKLFGRPLQKRFARRALERMQTFVKEELEAKIRRAPPPQEDAPTVQLASAKQETEEKLKEAKEQAISR
ncbi:MAG: DUF1990 domain-containing protein [Chloroflexota bacterium]|nr:DUF1990 domain-containing protein [Chloroflexota bacterium]